jgi:hypothetical protein
MTTASIRSPCFFPCILIVHSVNGSQQVYFYYYFIIYFWQYWHLNSGSCPWEAGTLPAWAVPPALCTFSYFSGRSHFCWRLTLGRSPPTYTSCIAGMTAMCTMPGLLIDMEVSVTLCLDSSQTSIIPNSASWVLGIAGVSHHTLPQRTSLKTC